MIEGDSQRARSILSSGSVEKHGLSAYEWRGSFRLRRQMEAKGLNNAVIYVDRPMTVIGTMYYNGSGS